MEFENTMKNARKKLETPLESSMPCKALNVTKPRETCGDNPDNQNLRYTWILQAHESGRMRIKETQQRDHEDHIAEKGFNSLSH